MSLNIFQFISNKNWITINLLIIAVIITSMDNNLNISISNKHIKNDSKVTNPITEYTSKSATNLSLKENKRINPNAHIINNK